MLHLHGFDRDHDRAGVHALAVLHTNGHHRTGHRAGQLRVPAVFVVGPHRRLTHLLDHRGAAAARQPDLAVGCGHQVLGAQPVQRDGQPITVERCCQRMSFAVFDSRRGRARCADQVHVVGALTGMQPERRRRPLPHSPARRHLPQVADRCGPAAQPLVGRRGDQLVVAVLRRNVVGSRGGPAVRYPGGRRRRRDRRAGTAGTRYWW